ncbi:MAG: 3-keto-disaccharide hydrolase [Flavisolibacter sp.]
MKNNIILNFLLSALIISCSASKNVGDNKLSKTEKNQGYKLLFNGKNMDGWRTYQNKSAESWFVDSGTLHCKGSSANYGAITADLMTKDQYENFDLSVDYKISPKGNSGILYLVTEDNAYSYLSGPEYQIIDDVNFPEKLEDWQHTAANYAMDPAPGAQPNPAGEWNHARIVKAGNHVEHWLNGKKVVEYELHSDSWNKKKALEKWKDVPTYGQAAKGYITFQNHGSEAWFRNIKIREL